MELFLVRYIYVASLSRVTLASAGLSCLISVKLNVSSTVGQHCPKALNSLNVHLLCYRLNSKAKPLRKHWDFCGVAFPYKRFEVALVVNS